MASLVVAGDVSGSVTLSAPSAAGSTVITLPTTSGTMVVTGGAQTVQFAAGSAASPSITFTGDTNTGIFSPAADTIAFSEGGVESMRIDSSGNVLVGVSSITGYSGRFIVGVADGNGWYSTIGSTSTGVLLGIRSSTASIGTVGATNLALNPDGGNVGIGTTSPAVRLDVNGSIAIPNSTQAYQIKDTGGTQRYVMYYSSGVSPASGNDLFVGNTLNNAVVMFTNNTERMRITSGGFTKISNTGTYFGSTGPYHEIRSDVAADTTLLLTSTSASFSANGIYHQIERNTTNNTFYAYSYYNGGAGAYKYRIADSGNVTNTNGSYGTISDIKNKENIVDATPKLDKISQLQVRNFNFKGDDLKQIGFIAQEFEQVFPSMVEEHKDTDAEGNDLGTTTKSIKTSVLVPILVKALQELNAKVEAQAAEIAALKGAN